MHASFVRGWRMDDKPCCTRPVWTWPAYTQASVVDIGWNLIVWKISHLLLYMIYIWQLTTRGRLNTLYTWQLFLHSFVIHVWTLTPLSHQSHAEMTLEIWRFHHCFGFFELMLQYPQTRLHELSGTESSVEMFVVKFVYCKAVRSTMLLGHHRIAIYSSASPVFHADLLPQDHFGFLWGRTETQLSLQ